MEFCEQNYLTVDNNNGVGGGEFMEQASKICFCLVMLPASSIFLLIICKYYEPAPHTATDYCPPQHIEITNINQQ